MGVGTGGTAEVRVGRRRRGKREVDEGAGGFSRRTARRSVSAFLREPFAEEAGDFCAGGEEFEPVAEEVAGGDGALVGEGVEAEFAAVAAEAAVAEAAEGEVEVGGVFADVVDGDAAGGDVVEEGLGEGFVAGEAVEGEGGGEGVEFGEEGGGVAVGEDGEDGAEDFLAHGGGVPGGVGEETGGEVEGGGVVVSFGDGFSVQQAPEALVVAFVDDAGQFLLPRVVLEGVVEFLDEGVLDVLVGEDEVGGEAGLSGVEEFADEDAAGGDGEVGVVVDDAGALAAEFEDVGGEVGGGVVGDEAADGGAAGEEDEVEALLEEALGDFRAAAEGGDVFGGKAVGEEAGEEAVAGGGEFGGFEDDRVAGRDGGDEGAEGELDGVIPGGDDEGHAAGFAEDAVAAGPEIGWGGGAAGFEPAAEGALEEAEFLEEEVVFGEEGLEFRLAEIGGEGCEQFVLAVDEGVFEALEGGEAGGEVPGAAAGKEGALGLEDGEGRGGVGHADGEVCRQVMEGLTVDKTLS